MRNSFINAKSKTKPGIVDAACNPILNPEEEIYSGMYGRASINFYCYNTGMSKGIACGLNNVQKIADGERLGGRASAESDFKDEDDGDTYAVAGVDLSATTDLTAAVIVVVKNGKKYVLPHFFMPSEVLQKRIEEDSVPYDIWVRKGFITLTEGSKNDFSKVTEWFLHLVRDYEIRPLWVGYDPWNSQYWVDEMEEASFTLEKIRQGVYTLSEPMKQLEADIKNKDVIYDNNPVLKWCLANTQAKVDINGNIQPSKVNSRFKRIDGAVALIIAYAVLNRYTKEYENMQS